MKLYLTHQYFKLCLFLKNDVYEFITGLAYLFKRFKTQELWKQEN